jgi:hypothetical protein
METIDQTGQRMSRLDQLDQWKLIQHLLRNLLGGDPEEEVPLCDPDGTVYAFIVPARKRFGLVERGPEEWATLEASIGGDADSTLPADEVLSVLEAAEDSPGVATRLEALRMRNR